jgi:hypothetical protein
MKRQLNPRTLLIKSDIEIERRLYIEVNGIKNNIGMFERKKS